METDFFFWLILCGFWGLIKGIFSGSIACVINGFHSDFSFLNPNIHTECWTLALTPGGHWTACSSILSLGDSLFHLASLCCLWPPPAVCLWFQTEHMITGLSSLVIQSSDKGLDIRSHRIRSGYPTTWPRQGKPLFYYLIP